MVDTSMINILSWDDDESYAANNLEGMLEPSWSIRCRQCRLSRQYGTGKLSAQTAAETHAFKHGHKIDLLNQDVKVKLVEFDAPKLLPDDPPF